MSKDEDKTIVINTRTNAIELASLILFFESRGDNVKSLSAAADQSISLAYHLIKHKIPQELTFPEAIGVLSRFKNIRFSKKRFIEKLTKEVNEDGIEEDREREETIEERAKRLSES